MGDAATTKAAIRTLFSEQVGRWGIEVSHPRPDHILPGGLIASISSGSSRPDSRAAKVLRDELDRRGIADQYITCARGAPLTGLLHQGRRRALSSKSLDGSLSHRMVYRVFLIETMRARTSTPVERTGYSQPRACPFQHFLLLTTLLALILARFSIRSSFPDSGRARPAAWLRIRN